jgi:tRNA1(Val) A37 N6-methylase TrmN6
MSFNRMQAESVDLDGGNHRRQVADQRETSQDAVLGGRLVLRQPRRGHRVGHDAMLLAAATAACPGEHAVELGSGVGAAGLALAFRVPGLVVTLIEVDAGLAALAAENIAINSLAGRVRAVTLDVGAAARAFAEAGLEPATAVRVLMNPPFNDPDRHQGSPDGSRSRAHVGRAAQLATFVRCASRLLTDRGVLTMIWRADGLDVVLGALAGRFGATMVLPLHPRAGRPAVRVLLRAVKGSRSPMSLLPGFTLTTEDGRPTSAAEAVLRGDATLPIARS